MNAGADVTSALRDPIKKYASRAFGWGVGRQGPVPLSELRKFDVVIWATGETYENTLTPQDQNNLRQYLEGGGKLIVTGQDVGYDIGDSSFYRDVLKSRFVADSSGTASFSTSGPLGSANYRLNADGSAKNQYYPDVLAPLSGATLAGTWGEPARAQAQSIQPDNDKGNGKGKAKGKAKGRNREQRGLSVQALSTSGLSGAIVLNDAGRYRTINMGFGLEGLSPQARDALVRAALEWISR